MDLREIGWGSMHWFDIAQDKRQWKAIVNTVNEPAGFITYMEILE
jgi:hypothetical protein